MLGMKISVEFALVYALFKPFASTKVIVTSSYLMPENIYTSDSLNPIRNSDSLLLGIRSRGKAMTTSSKS